MDTSDINITFDEHGVCNHCKEHESRIKKYLTDEKHKQRELNEKIAKIKQAGKNREYDCLIGLSGGVDSSFVAWKVKELGLRPLAVHLDNGWNSELAVKNIENIVRKLDIDLYTHVIDWEEFKDLQLSFFKASVVDIELTSDHAIFAVLYKIAAKYGIKHIINGQNMLTEGILPASWIWDKNDLRNILAIHKRFGRKALRTYPKLGLARYLYFSKIRKIAPFSLLNYLDFDRDKVIGLLKEKLSWKPYVAKHHESLFTAFYQGYILVDKFKFDKRRAHLSCLIVSGKISRDEALAELETPSLSQKETDQGLVYTAKKFGYSPEDFNKLLALPAKSHLDYPSYHNMLIYKILRKAYRFAKRHKLIREYSVN